MYQSQKIVHFVAHSYHLMSSHIKLKVPIEIAV